MSSIVWVFLIYGYLIGGGKGWVAGKACIGEGAFMVLFAFGAVSTHP
jgi:hypothetical protein